MAMALSAAILVLLLWVLGALFLDRYGQRPLPEGTFDAVIVPGCAVRSDGSASGALRRRTLHAVELWKTGRANKILLTGGGGKYPPSEAAVAAKLAQDAGVTVDDLLLEHTSTTTEENARFSSQMSAEMVHWSIIVASDGYHCWRCKRLFSRYFAHVTTAGSIPSRRLRIRGAFREVVSIIKMWLH